MSNVGVRQQKSGESRLIDLIEKEEARYIDSLKPISGESVTGLGGQGSQSGGTPGNPSGNFLPLAGGQMKGPIAFNPVFIEILNNSLDVSKLGGFSGLVITGCEGAGTTDQLDSIPIIDTLPGRWLEIQGTVGETLEIRHLTGGGNIRTPTGASVFLADNQNVLLVYDIIAGQWAFTDSINYGANTALSNLTNPTSINQDLLFSGLGFDIADATFPLDNLNVEQIRLRDGDLVVNLPMLTSITGSTFDINFPTGSTFNIYEQGVAKHIFSASSLTSPNIILSDTLNFNDSVGDPISNGMFQRNGTHMKVYSGGAVRNLSDIGASTGANTALSNLTNPTAINQDLLFGATGFDIGNDTNPVDDIFVNQVRLRTGSIVVNNAMITRNATNSMLLNVALGEKFFFDFNGVSEWDMSATSLTGDNIILTNTLTINDSVGDPSANGQLQRNGTNLKVFTGGAVVNLSDLANKTLSNLTSPTSINQDLLFSGTGFDLGNNANPIDDIFVNQVRFRTGTIVVNNAMITRDASDSMLLNVATGQKYFFEFNGVSEWDLSSSTLTGDNIILANTLTINDSTTDPSANGQFSRNGTHLKVYSGGAVRNLSDIGAGGGNAISQLNSSVTVNDVGSGAINMVVDAVAVLDIVSTFASLAVLLEMGADIDMNANDIVGIATLVGRDTGLDSFKIIFDGAVDSDTYFGDSATEDRINVFCNAVNVVAFLDSGILMGGAINMNTNGITNVSSMTMSGDIDMNGNDIIELGPVTITGLTEDTAPNPDADFVMSYDDSATALKKVKMSNLPKTGGYNVPHAISSNGFYSTPHVGIDAIYIEIFLPDTLYAIPFVPMETITIDQLSLHCSTIGAGTVDAWVGVYDTKTDGTNYPDQRVARWSSKIALTSTGIKNITITPTTVQLQGGKLYWLAYLQENGTTEPEISSWAGHQLIEVMHRTSSETTSANGGNHGWQVASTFSNTDMPTSFPAGGTKRGDNLEHPALYLRVLSVP